MPRRKKDFFGAALERIVVEAARGIGKRLRTALATPKPAAAVVPQNPKPQTQNPVVNVFQGPTQVNVQRRQPSGVRRQKKPANRKPRAANQDVVDVEFKVKP